MDHPKVEAEDRNPAVPRVDLQKQAAEDLGASHRYCPCTRGSNPQQLDLSSPWIGTVVETRATTTYRVRASLPCAPVHRPRNGPLCRCSRGYPPLMRLSAATLCRARKSQTQCPPQRNGRLLEDSRRSTSDPRLGKHQQLPTRISRTPRPAW